MLQPETLFLSYSCSKALFPEIGIPNGIIPWCGVTRCLLIICCPMPQFMKWTEYKNQWIFLLQMVSIRMWSVYSPCCSPAKMQYGVSFIRQILGAFLDIKLVIHIKWSRHHVIYTIGFPIPISWLHDIIMPTWSTLYFKHSYNDHNIC